MTIIVYDSNKKQLVADKAIYLGAGAIELATKAMQLKDGSWFAAAGVMTDIAHMKAWLEDKENIDRPVSGDEDGFSALHIQGDKVDFYQCNSYPIPVTPDNGVYCIGAAAYQLAVMAQMQHGISAQAAIETLAKVSDVKGVDVWDLTQQ